MLRAVIRRRPRAQPRAYDAPWPDADDSTGLRRLQSALELLRGLGLRLDIIYPADDPHSAILTHDGISIRLTLAPGRAAAVRRTCPISSPNSW